MCLTNSAFRSIIYHILKKMQIEYHLKAVTKTVSRKSALQRADVWCESATLGMTYHF